LQEIYEATENQENLTLLCLSANYEPGNLQEVAQDGIFKYATNIEMKDIKKNGVPKPVSLRIEHKNGVMSRKCGMGGRISNGKLKDTEQGQLQKTLMKKLIVIRWFSRVTCLDTIRLILSLDAKYELRIQQMNQKSTF
jgi:hypothetical protein